MKMSIDTIKVYISSKNRKENEKANDFTVDFPSGMIKCDSKQEFMVMNLNGIIMQNSFYNTQEINNKYKVIVDNTLIYDILNPIGNYNVLELLDVFGSYPPPPHPRRPPPLCLLPGCHPVIPLLPGIEPASSDFIGLIQLWTGFIRKSHCKKRGEELR